MNGTVRITWFDGYRFVHVDVPYVSIYTVSMNLTAYCPRADSVCKIELLSQPTT